MWSCDTSRMNLVIKSQSGLFVYLFGPFSFYHPSPHLSPLHTWPSIFYPLLISPFSFTLSSLYFISLPLLPSHLYIPLFLIYFLLLFYFRILFLLFIYFPYLSHSFFLFPFSLLPFIHSFTLPSLSFIHPLLILHPLYLPFLLLTFQIYHSILSTS